jgi:4-hydroxybenzoate polyprenyltransferase
MASSEATEPVSETEAAGGVGGEAADGPGHAPIPARADRPGRGLAVYLLHPRPDAWAKALIAPACFVLGAVSTGRFAGWPRLLVLWLALELLIYAARYQWNDIRGIDSDRRHPEQRARSRLPAGPAGQARRRGVRISAAVAALRIVVALLIGLAAGLLGQVALLTAAVLVTAAGYEFLRSLPARATRVPAPVQAVAVWLAVGPGYLIRGGLGLSLAGLAWGSLAMVAGLVCVASFGIMFVLLTWALEATSYCEEDAAGGWHARPDLAAKPHLAALLRYAGRPVAGAAGPGPGRYCGSEPVLRNRGRLFAPWNLALAAAAAFGAAEGLALSRPAAGGAGGYLAVTAAGLAGAVLLARCRGARGRWLVAAAWAPVLVAAALPAAPGLPVLAGVPWLAISGVYATLRGWSYRDLLTASPAAADWPRSRL